MSDDCEYDPNESAAPWCAGDDERETRGDKPPRGRQEPKPKKTKHERACPEFEDFAGYEGAAFIGSVELEPPVNPMTGDPPERQFDGATSLSEAECREAFRAWVDGQLCFGKKPVEEMEYVSCTSVAAFHYKLETFSESRKTKKKKKPYKGGPVDGPEYGPAPLPWEIPCAPKHMFKDDKVKEEVPHTAKVKKCKDCKGRGWETCDECDGWGKVECWVCEGEGSRPGQDEEGNPQDADCMHCSATGEKCCLECGGDGRTTCDDCEGYKKLRCFMRLKVKFNNHTDQYVLERTDLPDEVIATAGGATLYEETQPRLYPIQNFPVHEINQHSMGLLQTHAANWPKEFIHAQRHSIRCVPVTEVSYKWEDGAYRFWVYGTERNVYAPDYPQQCCCGCAVL